MIAKREDWQVKCPYYGGEQETQVFCSGVMEGKLLSVHFERKMNKREHKYDFCKGNYFACPLYQAAEP